MTRPIVASLALVAVGVLLVWQVGRFLNSGSLPLPIDFAAYWSAGRLTLDGENPYDPVRMHELQKAIGLNHYHAILAYQPPFALTFLLPFGALPVRVGYAFLCLLDIAIVIASADFLWRSYGGVVERRWVGWLVGLGFAPTLFLCGAGQVSALSLAGLVLFLAAAKANRPSVAGFAAVLVAMKPHLNFLFALALFLETLRSGFARRAVLAGFGFGFAASGIPMLFNADVWSHHANLVTAPGSEQHQGLADWQHPLIGSWVRGWLPGRPAWVQALPCLVTALAFLPYWWRKMQWDWAAELPRLTLVSLLTAVYGAWSFDLVLLLVPIVAAVASSSCSLPPWGGGLGWGGSDTPEKANLLPMPASPHPNPPPQGVREQNKTRLALGALLLVNVLLYLALALRAAQDSYVWVTPAVIASILVMVPRLQFRPRVAS